MMDVITLGETMVLFTPRSKGLMRYAGDFSAKIAGAESNVAIGLARLGHKSAWISRLGNDEFGKKILSFIRGEGVDVSEVRFDSTAGTGLYFKEELTAEEIRVQYYRKFSAASRMTPDELNEAFIQRAQYVHLTGITPALSKSCYETVKKVIDIAKKNGVTVVFDPNLRRKLWMKDEAKKVFLDIASQSDIVLPGITEGEFLFGKHDPEQLAQHFYDKGASLVVLKLGEKGAYYLSAEDKGFVPGFHVDHVVDPIGAGDGFAAGLLSGLLDELPLRQAVERGTAVGALVTMVPGDIEGLPDRGRLEMFVKGTDQEDVKR